MALDAEDPDHQEYAVVSLLRRLRDDPITLGLRLRFSRLVAATLVPLGLFGFLGGADWQAVLLAVLGGLILVAIGETAAGSRSLRGVTRLPRGAGYSLWVRLTLPATRISRPLVRLRSRPLNLDRGMVMAESRVAMADVGGRLGLEERRILRRLLASSTIMVRDIMTPWSEVDRLEESLSLSEAVDLVRLSLHSRMPVESGDRLVGMVTVKDLLPHVHHPRGEAPPLGSLLRPLYFEREDATMRALLDDLREVGSHVAVVLDRFGRPAGLVTVEDILEEIVGELHDERERREEIPR
jgi:CBS domain containing-hemolysin-like protein